MTAFWFSAETHPDGPSTLPWFRIEGEWGYRAPGHPEGASTAPSIKIEDGDVFAVVGWPTHRGDPCFEIIGSCIYPVGANAPWFYSRQAASARPDRW